MKSKYILLGIILILISLVSCKMDKAKSQKLSSLSELEDMINPVYRINHDSVRLKIRSHLMAVKEKTPWDSAMIAHYWNGGDFIWMDKPESNAADSLLYWLDNVSRHGLRSDLYPTTTIREKLSQIRSLQFQDGNTLNGLLADVEYQLTSAYLSYVCKLKFGFLPPERRWNDSVAWVSLKRCDKQFVEAALDSLKANPNAAFHWAQPASRYYTKLQQEFERVNSWGATDTTEYYRNRLSVNMERARWQYALDKGKKYVSVNVAAYMLQAINEKTDTVVEMKICVGKAKNKTPLLSSRIYYMELNPFWNVPQSIIKKEIIPTYRRDTTYFTRNRMKVYDKEGNQLDPHSIKWAKYAGENVGVPYSVKQDNKTGNSLGRIIFRFPNKYDVYLHDTPSRGAFWLKTRAVSHGCVRLERALDFALFLLKDKDKLLEDQIRIAMDIKPVSEEGKKLSRSAAYNELKHYSLKEYIPLYIDYQTVYLSKDGKLSYCEDIYDYDSSLLAAMKENDLISKP